jgi:hypothetical protein
MLARVARAIAVAALVGAALTGCAGSPEPHESTTTPMSDEEAFAAAEETYRAYVDAVNARRVDEHSTPPPQDFLIGEALEADLETSRQLEQQGLRILGETEVTVTNFRRIGSGVELLACLDVSETRVINEAGEDVTPTDRAGSQAVTVTVDQVNDFFAIAQSFTAEASCSE